MRANIGIWSEHHQSYPRSPSHPRDTQPIPPSPSLDMYKLLLENPASCLWNWLTSTQWQKIVVRVGEDWALSVIALFSVFILYSAWLRSWGKITVPDYHVWGLLLVYNDICVATFVAPSFIMMLNLSCTHHAKHIHIHPVSDAFKAFRNVAQSYYRLTEATLFVASCLCVPLCTFHGLRG